MTEGSSIAGLEFDDTAEFNRKLAALRGELVNFHQRAFKGLELAGARILFHLAGEMSVYPPPPPNSSYRRTGTLGRLWAVARPQFTVSGTQFEGRIGNATPYAQWVQSDDKQAAIHQGRWRTVQQVIEANRDVVTQELERAGSTLVEAIAEVVNNA